MENWSGGEMKARSDFLKKLHKVIRQSGHGGPDSAQACMCTSSTPEMGRVEEEGTWVPVLKEQ